MANRSISSWLIAIVVLGVLVGIVGGGMMGGAVGYYVVLNRAPVALAAPAQPVAAQAPTAQPPALTNITVTEGSALIEAAKKVEPAVVTVINTLSQQSGPLGSGSGVASGSGVIVDAQGHIITNNHVVDGASRLDVIFQDGSKVQATLVGADVVSDLAVLQVGSVPAAASFGDSDALQLGETVLAIGSPLGNYRGSVTVGVVSGMNRSVSGTEQDGLIQTDAAINHGNSGGPLVNLTGQVIGINTLVVRDTSNGDVAEGLGFAIPSKIVSAVAQQLIAKGKVEYPFIGIRYTEITPQNAAENNLPVQQGVVVSDVTPGSPAAKAGIRADDIVTALDNNKIDENHSLRQILFQYHIGDTVTLDVLRGGRTFSVKVTLVTRPEQTRAGGSG